MEIPNSNLYNILVHVCSYFAPLIILPVTDQVVRSGLEIMR